jgi:hypothetical protein
MEYTGLKMIPSGSSRLTWLVVGSSEELFKGEEIPYCGKW